MCKRIFLPVVLAVLLLGVARAWAAMEGEREPIPQPLAPFLERVSISWNGNEGNNDSYYPEISGDGRFIVFQSSADNLVADDTNGVQDIFLLDKAARTLQRVSLNTAGQEANGESRHATISHDGRFIAYESIADNLAAGDDNGTWDIFLFDRQQQETIWISRGPDGAAGNGDSVGPTLSAAGDLVAFVSLADNLVAGDSNGKSDVFVYNRMDGSLEIVSVCDDATLANGSNRFATISGNGRFVAFQSMASNLAPGTDGYTYHVYVHDRQSGTTTLVSRTPAGMPGNQESQRPVLSADGRYIAFESWADDLVAGDANGYSDVFVYDQLTGEMEIASLSRAGTQSNHVSGTAAISADGRFVAFASLADNLAGRDENYAFDVFMHDRWRQETRLISFNWHGYAGNGSSINPTLSADGRYAVFDSLASDLVQRDVNSRLDVFALDQWPQGTFRLLLPVALR